MNDETTQGEVLSLYWLLRQAGNPKQLYAVLGGVDEPTAEIFFGKLFDDEPSLREVCFGVSLVLYSRDVEEDVKTRLLDRLNRLGWWEDMAGTGFAEDILDEVNPDNWE